MKERDQKFYDDMFGRLEVKIAELEAERDYLKENLKKIRNVLVFADDDSCVIDELHDIVEKALRETDESGIPNTDESNRE